MYKLTHTAIVTAGIRGFVCAGISTVITAFFSWSFVASTDTLDWMGSNSPGTPAIAMLRTDNEASRGMA